MAFLCDCIPMNAIYRAQDSWEKQSIWELDNAWQATVEYSIHYGEHITRLDNPDKTFYWHCSNGLKDLPEFAKDWIEDVGAGNKLVKVKFNKIWPNGVK